MAFKLAFTILNPQTPPVAPGQVDFSCLPLPASHTQGISMVEKRHMFSIVYITNTRRHGQTWPKVVNTYYLRFNTVNGLVEIEQIGTLIPQVNPPWWSYTG
jgi:hypothetical protein